jgi:hypothetical protein
MTRGAAGVDTAFAGSPWIDTVTLSVKPFLGETVTAMGWLTVPTICATDEGFTVKVKSGTGGRLDEWLPQAASPTTSTPITEAEISTYHRICRVNRRFIERSG